MKKKNRLLLVIGCMILFLGLTQKSTAQELLAVATSAKTLKPIVFNVKREGGKYVLTDLKVEQSFGTIQSITITMPTGVHFNLNQTLPTGWTTNNKPTDSVINYILKGSNTPAEVQNTLSAIYFSIQDEEATLGQISISLSEEKIKAWVDDETNITHYTKFVPAYGIKWLDAYNQARKQTYKGLTGYLATITSASEHNYVFTIAENPGWLGGTRLVHNDGTQILDDTSIPTTINSFDTSKDIWYWADGPEAGEAFLIGKEKPSIIVPSGAYDGWSVGEPNNGNKSGNVEYALQFAFNKTKWWNDLPNDYWGMPEIYAHGYYVEFSAYGEDQVEIEENSYSADVPQRVKVRYLDQESNEPILSEPEVVSIGDTFSIGSQYDASSFKKEIEGYDFVRVDHEKGEHKNKQVAVDYFYKKQELQFNLQQVLLNTNDQVVVPSKGYIEIQTIDALKPADGTTIFEKVNVFATSITADDFDYLKTTLVRNPLGGRYYQVKSMIPAYYEYLGYMLTANKTAHTPSQLMTGFPIIDSNGKKEYWITFYLKPVTALPIPYSQGYQSDKIGELK